MPSASSPQQEQVAKLHYQRQGYVVYLPMMRTIVRNARRAEAKLKPFFSGYLFLYLAPDEGNWGANSSTPRRPRPDCFGDQYSRAGLGHRRFAGLRKMGADRFPLAELQKKGLIPGVEVSVQLDDNTSTQGLFRHFCSSPFFV